MTDKQDIKLKIAEKYYPLTIDREEEEDIRYAAVIINKKLQQYRQKYKGDDKSDFFAMTCLDFAVELIKCNKKKNAEKLVENIKIIDWKLGNVIKNL